MKKNILIISSILILITGVYLFLPNSYNLRNIDDRLIKETQDITRVEHHYYLDGGSIGIELFEGPQKIKVIYLPITDNYKSYYITKSVSSLYSENGSLPIEEKIPMNEDTKSFLLDLMDTKSNQIYHMEQYKLTGNPVYFLKTLYKRLTH